MSRTSWRDGIEQTQLVLRQSPDVCFVCRREVPVEGVVGLVEAYGDAERRRRIAVVCDREECRHTLEDQQRDVWGALFRALMAWPDPGIAPLGPYWRVLRADRFTFRTDPRRTVYTT